MIPIVWNACFVASAAATLAGPVIAQPSEEHARVRLVSERTALVPGTTAMLGFAFDIDPGWHLYWNGRNDSGFPPEAKLTLPPGLEAGELQWPAPQRHVAPGDILDHIYEKRVTLLLPVRVSPDARPGERLRVRASLDWLVCEEACLPGSGEAELTLPVVETTAEASPSADARLFEEARARLPRPRGEQPDVGPLSMALTGGASGAKFEARAENAEWMAFYPAEECSPATRAIAECEVKGNRLVVSLDGGDEARAVGVLEVRIRGRASPLFYEVRLGQGAEGAGAPAPDGAVKAGD